MARAVVYATVLQIDGVPGGCVAHPIGAVADDGARLHRDRKRRSRVTEIALAAAEPPPEPAPIADRAFVLGADVRRWASIVGRYDSDAWRQAIALVVAGTVVLRCEVSDPMRLGAPISWELSEHWRAHRAEARLVRDRSRTDIRARADAAADAVESLAPNLAAAIRACAPGTAEVTVLDVLTAAAEDLAAGITHDGPRAFVETHFATSKQREDLIEVLRAGGCDDDLLARLGVRRSARIGVAHLAVAVGSDATRAEALDGPVLLRADQPGLAVAAARSDQPLVVIENLQAAEAVADRWPRVGLFYTGGLMGPHARGLLAQLGGTTPAVLVCCDADVGGVRITEQVLDAVPHATVIDVGAVRDSKGPAFAADGATAEALRQCTGAASPLAAAILARGYTVEQEAYVIRAVASALGDIEAVSPSIDSTRITPVQQEP